MLEDDEPVEILDVRSAEEFDGPLGHIDGARNVPVGELDDRIDELEDLRDRRIVTVCRTDNRSDTAARRLEEEGFDEVVVLAGGMQTWSD